MYQIKMGMNPKMMSKTMSMRNQLSLQK